MAVKEFHEACRRLDGGTDSQLQDYFTTTNALVELADFRSQRVVAVGLKGIGKSSSFRYLAEFDTSVDVPVPINLDTFSLNLPTKNLHWGACCRQFEQDLVIEALRAVAESAGKLQKKCPKALLDAAQRHVDSFLERLKKATGRVRGFGVSVLGCGFTVTRGEAATLVGLMPDKEITGALESLRKICGAGVAVRIIVDDPELVFSTSQTLDVHLIGGFCLAALRLSAAVPGFKVVGLLKTHVYHPVRLAIEDLAKYPDHKARLSWIPEELEDLVANRLRWAHARWTGAFHADSENAARELIRQISLKVRSGPRDLLRWIDLALQVSEDTPIARKHFDKTLDRFSRDSFKEMESAHNAQRERIGAVIKAIFRNCADQVFNHGQFGHHLETLLVKDHRLKVLTSLGWLQQESSDTLPELLVEVGALAFRVGQQIVLPYQPDYDLETFESADQLMLVPALVPAVKAA